MQFGNADVVGKFIFQYFSIPPINCIANIFVQRTNKNNLNNSSSQINFGQCLHFLVLYVSIDHLDIAFILIGRDFIV
jgi:hypothetical protein